MTKSSGKPTSVYIAEDNPILLQGLERALSSSGYEVRTADGGQALLGLLDDPALPDIVLLDVMMPGMSGLEVLEEVRANPRTADLPVMLITAAAEEILPASRLAESRVDLLMKPFRLNELLTRIDEIVEAVGADSPGDADLSETALIVEG